MQKIYAIVVTYNGKKWYDRCFGSLRDSETPVETIVIDNASSDGTVEYIKAHFPNVHLIESKENLGFAKANNIGIRYVIDNNADYVFLLNQDAWVEKDTLTELLRTFEDNENVGIASPMHLNGSCTALDKRFAHYMGEEFASDAFLQKTKHYYKRPFINAAAWLIGRSCIETVGGFDTMLFYHYGEDDNYCQRVLYHGFNIIADSRCTICHDREDNENYKDKYQTMSSQTPFFREKSSWGNINEEYGFAQIKKGLRKKYLKKILLCKFQEARGIEQEISCIELIESSRKINVEKGRHWL